MHVALATELVLSPATMDGAIAAVWHAFDASPLTHVPLFEASLAVGAFVLWFAFFESLHLWLPGAQDWRLDKQLPSKPLSCFREDVHKTAVPALTYLGSIWLGQQLGVFTALFGSRPVFTEAPTFAQFSLEVIIGVVLYDLLFYPFHRSFHSSKAPLAWREQHGRHHQWGRQEVHAHNACETVQNSYLDAGIQVMINIFVQNISPWGFGCKHPLSRAAHNLMVTYLLSEAHSGYDLPFQSHRLFPAIFGGSVRHEEHHQRGSVCFHQFFKYLDDSTGAAPRAAPEQGPDGAGSEAQLWLAADCEVADSVSRGLTPARDAMPDAMPDAVEVRQAPYASGGGQTLRSLITNSKNRKALD